MASSCNNNAEFTNIQTYGGVDPIIFQIELIHEKVNDSFQKKSNKQFGLGPISVSYTLYFTTMSIFFIFYNSAINRR